MMYYLIIIAVIVILIVFGRFRDPLRHIPGPRRMPLVGNTLQIDGKRARLSFKAWHKRYGKVIRVRMIVGDVIVVSGYQNIHEVLISKGYEFGDRPKYFRLSYICENTGIGPSSPTAIWRTLRKLVHQHLKQFGDGKTKLESLITVASDQMLETFYQRSNQPFDPRETIKDATLFVIERLVVGSSLNKSDDLYKKLQRFSEEQSYIAASMSVDFLLLDLFPFLLRIPFRASKVLKSTRQNMQECWVDIQGRQNIMENTLARTLISKSKSTGKATSKASDDGISETDAFMSCMLVLAAGQITTATTFYCIIGALASRPNIQDKAFKHIASVTKTFDTAMLLKHKEKLPYIQAIILEVLRLFTISHTAVPHMTLCDTDLSEFGTIPKGTIILPNLWDLHHDESFWIAPDEFRPERFLDENGALLPADHPNRRHLLPFGAGTRVCVAEVFALSRLFIWTVALIQRFQISLVDNTYDWMDPNIHHQDLNLRPLPYRAMFKQRDIMT